MTDQPAVAHVLARAHVLVTVEVANIGPYAAGWTIDAIFDQAAREGSAAVQRALGSGMRVVGEPKVTCVMVDSGKR